MQYSDFLNGFLKSGGWRFGGKPSSTETFQNLYTPEPYNGGLLNQVGNPNKQGPVTAAVSAAPVSTAVTTGLLGGGDRHDRTSGPFGNGTGLSDKDWGTVKDMRDAYGGWSPYDKTNMKDFGKMALAFFSGNPLAIGTSMASTYSNKDQQAERLSNFQKFQDAQGPNGWNNAMAANAALREMGLPDSNQGVQFAPQSKDEVNAIVNAAISAGGGGDRSVDGNGGADRAADAGRDHGNSGSAPGGGAWNGGLMTPDRVHGPNPDNPDDGYTSIQVGEYVVKKSAVKKLGKKTLDNINKGKLKKG